MLQLLFFFDFRRQFVLNWHHDVAVLYFIGVQSVRNRFEMAFQSYYQHAGLGGL